MPLIEGIWVECPDCDEFWCLTHDTHVADCPCPPIEEWAEQGLWPYGVLPEMG